MEDGRRKMEDGRWRWKMGDGRWKMGDGRWERDLCFLLFFAIEFLFHTFALSQRGAYILN
ncbi:hypothetical protein [Flavobacterium sp.]|jgi:hypothetical protein|uniref:hypothetical protein n=1 Tax=Flavobacterium sp. TaxID=239 RepID=UPI0037C0933D